MKVKMIAKVPMSFAGRVLIAGDRFEADDEAQAHLLQTIGHATRESEDEREKRTYRRRDMRAEH